MSEVAVVAVQFTVRLFFLHIPLELLRRYFDRRGELTSHCWDRFSLTDTDPLYDAWCALPQRARAESEDELHAIADLGTREGLLAVEEVARDWGIDVSAGFRAYAAPWQRAMWAFLEHPQIFEVARQLQRVSHLNGRYWRERLGVARRRIVSGSGRAGGISPLPDLLPPDLDGADLLDRSDEPRIVLASAAALRALDAAPVIDAEEACRTIERCLSDLVRAREHRDDPCPCTVHHFRRGGRDLFVAYPEEGTESVLRYVNGKLRAKHERRVAEVVFLYDALAGRLEVHAHGDRRLHEDLLTLFSRGVLRAELPPEKPGQQRYRVHLLRQRGMAFPTRPADHVRLVRVKAIRMRRLGGGLVTYDAGPLREGRNVYDEMDAWVAQHRVPESNVDVRSVTIQMMFDWPRRTGSLSFDLRPDGCSLRERAENQFVFDLLDAWELSCA